MNPAVNRETSTTSHSALHPSAPMTPPSPATRIDSVSTRKRMSPLPKPIALSTATSVVRSRIDIAIALPATQSSEKTTARPMTRIIPFRSPIISSNILPKASSVCVRVGKSLLRYMSSIALQTAGMTAAFLHLAKTIPALPEIRALAGRCEPEPITARFSASSKLSKRMKHIRRSRSLGPS